MKKIVLLFMLMLITTIPCYATEIIAEGTYIMSDTDTPASAEEGALIAAKRAALEQAGTFMVSSTTTSNLKLVDDQIRSLSAGIIQAEVLDKKRTYNGQAMVFWCKIKANVSTDKLSEAIENGFKSLRKPAIGIVTLVDITPKAKFDVKNPKDKNYNFNQFAHDFSIAEPFNLAMINKYNSRSLIAESRDTFTDYFKGKNTDSLQAISPLLKSFSEQYDYDYVLFNALKFNRIERVTGSAFFTLSMQMYWRVETVSNYCLYDAKNDKVIFTDTISEKKETQYPAGSWLYKVPDSAAEKALKSAIDDISQAMIRKASEKLPSI